jgi:hypothetical protein
MGAKMSYEVHYSLVGVERAKARDINNITRANLQSMGNEWLERYLGIHFTHRATRLYGYGPRKGEPGSGKAFKGSYTARKLKEFGHTKPLVKTGEGMRLAENSPVKATASGRGQNASVRVHLPQKFNLRNPNSKTRPADEIRATTRQENNALAEFLVRGIDHDLNTFGGRSSVRIT